MATLAPNGDVINCFAIRKPFGNILEASFDTIWNSETAHNISARTSQKQSHSSL